MLAAPLSVHQAAVTSDLISIPVGRLKCWWFSASNTEKRKESQSFSLPGFQGNWIFSFRCVLMLFPLSVVGQIHASYRSRLAETLHFVFLRLFWNQNRKMESGAFLNKMFSAFDLKRFFWHKRLKSVLSFASLIFLEKEAPRVNNNPNPSTQTVQLYKLYICRLWPVYE